MLVSAKRRFYTKIPPFAGKGGSRQIVILRNPNPLLCVDLVQIQSVSVSLSSAITSMRSSISFL